MLTGQALFTVPFAKIPNLFHNSFSRLSPLLFVKKNTTHTIHHAPQTRQRKVSALAISRVDVAHRRSRAAKEVVRCEEMTFLHPRAQTKVTHRFPCFSEGLDGVCPVNNQAKVFLWFDNSRSFISVDQIRILENVRSYVMNAKR